MVCWDVTQFNKVICVAYKATLQRKNQEMPYCLYDVGGGWGRGAVCQQTLWVVNVVEGVSTLHPHYTGSMASRWLLL